MSVLTTHEHEEFEQCFLMKFAISKWWQRQAIMFIYWLLVVHKSKQRNILEEV